MRKLAFLCLFSCSGWAYAGAQTISVSNGSAGSLGQVLVSNGSEAAPSFVDPVVSQGTDSNLNASVSIKGSSNTIQVQGNVTVNPHALSGTVTVTPGTGTYPVSGALSQAGTYTETPGTGTWPVSGTFFQTIQPISSVGQFTVTPGSGNFVVTEIPNLIVSSTSVAGALVSTGAIAVSGQFHYISFLEITMYATAARTGGAAPVVCTTSNFSVPLAFTFDTAQAVGVAVERIHPFQHPIKSAVSNTLTSINCPATASVIWRVNMGYYSGI